MCHNQRAVGGREGARGRGREGEKRERLIIQVTVHRVSRRRIGGGVAEATPSPPNPPLTALKL